MKPKSLLLIGGGVLRLAALVLPGQQGRQEWSLSRYNGNTVRFSIDRWKPGSHSQISTDLPIERFRGLSPGVFRHGSAVKFEYVQDAGRLLCEGRVSFGRGSGTFTFLPDPNFVTALQRLDYDAPSESQLFDMVPMGVGLDDAQAARDAGLQASTRQLIDMRVHGVNAAYIKDVLDAGFRPSGAQDLIDMKIHGVASSFLRDLTAAGYERPRQTGSRAPDPRRQLRAPPRPQGLRSPPARPRPRPAPHPRRLRRLHTRRQSSRLQLHPSGVRPAPHPRRRRPLSPTPPRLRHAQPERRADPKTQKSTATIDR